MRARRPYLLSRRALLGGLRRTASAALLVVIDCTGVVLALNGALVAKELYRGNTPILWGVLWQTQADWLPFLFLVTVLVFWRGGLYGPRETRPGFSRVLSSLAVVSLVTLGFAEAIGQEFTTYTTFLVGFVLASVVVGVLRTSYDSAARAVLDSVGTRRRTLLVGTGPRIASLASSLGRDHTLRYEFVELLEDPARLAEALGRLELDEIVVEGNQLVDEELVELLDVAYRFGVTVRIAPTTAELLTHQAAYVPGGAVPLFELRPPVLSGADWALKRVFDLAVSVLVLLVGLPLWLAIAAAIRLTTPGPVLYRDLRVGVGEQEFAMLKFRTMRVGSDLLQEQLEAHNEADGALFKLRDDPRVTAVGGVLRRLSLDEVPQLLNVLRGEMSLVGPRPLPLRDYRMLEPWHRKRYRVLPGITGLWQISGRSELDFDDLVRLDFSYLETWSLWQDVSILLKTIPAVLSRRGAY